MFRKGITQVLTKVKVGVVGAPYNHGQPKLGVKDGPAVIRETGFIDRLRDLGHDVIDAGDIQRNTTLESEVGPSGEKNHNLVLEYNKRLAETIKGIRSEDRLTLVLGGDHSLSIGSITGHGLGTPHKQVVVLWVDAHADLNTGRSSSTKNMHGMVVPYLLKEFRNKVNRIPGCDWPQPTLEVRHLAYVGLRDLDIAEAKFIEELGILSFGMRDIDKLGLEETIARCLDQLQPTENRSLHVSFDIDSLDPIEAPSTGTPVRGGLSLREGLTIVEAAHSTGRLRGLDLVEVNPTLGTAEEAKLTLQAAKSIIVGAVAGARA